MILLIVSVLVLLAAVGLLLWARRKLATAEGRRAEAALAQAGAEETREIAAHERDAAQHERELAGALLEHVRKIEDSLTHPRFALHLDTGRVRALRHNEEPNLAEEIACSDPAPECKKCFGRGWNGRRRETGRVIPCPCVRQRA